MYDNARFAMNWHRCPDGPAAKGLVNTLHAQTDTQNGKPFVKGIDQPDGYTCMRRIFGAGADKNIIRSEGFSLFKGNPVTPMDMDAEIIAHEHLHKVVCKGVVIIYDE